MKKYSIWLDNINYKPNPELTKDLDLDVLIIGGGMTGLNIAYQLMNSNLKIALVERNVIAHGITARTTGKLTYLQETIYSDITKTYNKDIAQLYFQSQKEAISCVKKIIDKHHIDCDFEKVSSYIYTLEELQIDKLTKEKELLESFNLKPKSHFVLPDDTKVAYAISVNDTAVFNPIKYLIKLKEIINQSNLKIYEYTNITEIAKGNGFYICYTPKYKIKTKKVIFATHYPYFLFPYLFPFKTHLEKSYVAAFLVENNLKFSAITSKTPTTSIRYLPKDDKNYKITLIGSHNLAFKNNDNIYFNNLKNTYNPEFLWSNKDIITSDKMPLIGKIKDNLYIATGFNTWGMTNGTLAGIILKDLLTNKENKYALLFDPKRGLNKNSLFNLSVSIASNSKSFIASKINKNKSWYTTNIKFIKKDGKSLAIYTDEKNVEHIVYNICPHLKCSLIFNEEEKTWDCPCHGSRFDIDGHVIEGPSNLDISYKED